MIKCSTRCAPFLSLVLISLSALTGCGKGFTSSPVTSAAIVVTGNWQFTSFSPAAAQLSSFSGELSGTNTAFTGVLHTNSASSCISPKASFVVSGSADATNRLTLTGTSVAGGTLTLTGVLAPDGKSISNSTYTVSGGSCAFVKPADATSQSYSSISGTYTGNFVDADGDQFPVTANLTQNGNADANGNFSMDGTGTFPANPCFASPASVTNAQVSGNAFTFTYMDPAQSNQINVTGTFSADASKLTVSGWQSNGPCALSGTGTLTRQ